MYFSSIWSTQIRWYRFTWPWLCSKETIFKPINENWHLAWQPKVVYWLHLQDHIWFIEYVLHLSKNLDKNEEPLDYYLQYVTFAWCDIRVKMWWLMHNCRLPFPLSMNIIKLPAASTNGFGICSTKKFFGIR